MTTVSVTESQPITYAVMRYASEKDNIGKQNVGTWPQVRAMLNNRVIRQQKSGKAFSPVALKPGKTRANENVLSISIAVADIDSEGVKDNLTGQGLGQHRLARARRPQLQNVMY